MNIKGLDEYLTRSPYDEDPDYVEEAEKLIAMIGDLPQDSFEADVVWVLEGLLQIMENEGIL
jgi:hypothetical protein